MIIASRLTLMLTCDNANVIDLNPNKIHILIPKVNIWCVDIGFVTFYVKLPSSFENEYIIVLFGYS